MMVLRPTVPDSDVLALMHLRRLHNLRVVGNVASFDARGRCIALQDDGSLVSSQVANHFTITDNGAGPDGLDVNFHGPNGPPGRPRGACELRRLHRHALSARSVTPGPSARASAAPPRPWMAVTGLPAARAAAISWVDWGPPPSTTKASQVRTKAADSSPKRCPASTSRSSGASGQARAARAVKPTLTRPRRRASAWARPGTPASVAPLTT
ncbi:MAG: hypothetical protein R3F43_06100 [bacterium]